MDFHAALAVAQVVDCDVELRRVPGVDALETGCPVLSLSDVYVTIFVHIVGCERHLLQQVAMPFTPSPDSNDPSLWRKECKMEGRKDGRVEEC